MNLSRKQKLMVAVLIFGSFVTVLDQTLITPALPVIMKEMAVTTTTVQWLTTGFMLVDALVIPIAAYLMDRFTTRQLYITAMLVFALGSVVSAWGPSFPVLFLGRVIQAASAGVLMPLVMTVLMLTFPAERRGSAMGMFGIVIAFGPAVGPSIAGFMIDHASWRFMFLIISVLGVAVSAMAGALMLNVGETKANAKLDKQSVILSTCGLGLLLYGFSSIGSAGLNPVDAVLSVVGLAITVLFFRRQLAIENPMLEVRVFFNRTFLVGTVVGMLVQAALVAGGVLLPIYLQTLRGFSASASGIVILPGAILLGIMNPISGRLFDKYGPRWLAVTGTALLALSTAALGLVMNEDASLMIIIAVYAVRMFAISLVNMPVSTWAMGALDNRLMNHGSSANNMMRQVAGSFGTAVLISVSAAIAAGAPADQVRDGASIAGVNGAFLVGAVFCLIAFALVFLFVKNDRAGVREADPRDERKNLLETIMKRDVYTVPADAPVTDAMRLILDRGVSAVLVVDGAGKPAGFVSDGDILRFLSSDDRGTASYAALTLLPAARHHGFDEQLSKLSTLRVADIATRGVISVSNHTDLAEVCRVLGENHLKKVPVVNRDGLLVGVINRSDITRYAMGAYLSAHEA